MRELMEFNYGDTLRIRSDYIRSQARYATLILMGIYGMSINQLNIVINKAFWLRWDKKRDAYHFSKLCGKARSTDMTLVDSGYKMVTGTWGEVDVGTTDTG